MEKYLYHYTSIDTLLLILKNKTLAFNSLQNVDDLEEADSEDIEQIGKICYVSCWTNDDSESIPMWNMYTPNMQGVRIKLKEYPFKKYFYKKGEYFFNTDCESHINYKDLYSDDKACISPDSPLLRNVIYTEEKSKLYPRIKSVIKKAEKLDNGKININEKIKYSFEELGKYKRSNWSFQNEVRYIINMAPYSMKELMSCKSEAEQRKLISRLEDTKIKAPYKRFFLQLSDEAIKNIEVLLGPKITEEQEEIVKLIIDKYCPSAKILNSNLKGKLL